jgi:cell division protein FtsZ
MPGLVNLDFADVSAIMRDAGYAHMGVGRAAGKDKAEEAARMAISSPLLETSINGAKGVLINIIGSPDIALDEVEKAASLVQQAAHPDSNIIFGAALDDSLEDEIRVTIIATGFDKIITAPNPVPFTTFKPNASTPAPAAGATPAASESKTDADDDPFAQIMDIFNKGNK